MYNWNKIKATPPKNTEKESGKYNTKYHTGMSFRLPEQLKLIYDFD
jgi:hypothetical protein